jgi:hypothetical protein
MRKNLFNLLFILVSLSLSAQDTSTDYSHTENWAVFPGHYPDQLLTFAQLPGNNSVDVFYIYPTLLTDQKDERWNVELNDQLHRNSVLNSPVKFQASAWASAGSVYVPYYRQAHIKSYSSLDGRGREALLLAYSDIKAAFQEYLAKHNNGKGIILAGHSQGGTHVSLLLKDFFDGKPLQEQLVAAYLPGIGVPTDEFGTVHLMTKPDAVGGFVAWNTFKKRFDQNQYKWYKGMAVVNPVTWDTTQCALRDEHKGFLYSNGKLYTQSFDTHLSDGVVWISTPHFPFRYLAFTMKNYHVGDVNLFWEDIRQNAVLRSETYLRIRQGVK